MSESRKKNYKKRKKTAHTKTNPVHVNVREETKLQKFLNEWLWLVTLGVIVLLVALMIVFIPMCNEGGACYVDMDSCAKEDVVDETSDSDVADYIEQLLDPEDGEEIAVMETSKGTIKIRLFPENAPQTVANFKGLISEGYYDGITFHRVIPGFMIQGGDPTGTGTGGKTYSGQALPDEYDNGLYHFRYALSMANTGAPNSGSSQFFIVQSDCAFAGMDSTGTIVSTYTVDEMINNIGYEEGVAQFYNQFGGTPILDAEVRVPMGGVAHTVFGQVFEGEEIINTIANVATDDNDKPLEDVTINRVYLETYHDHEVSGADVSAADAQ